MPEPASALPSPPPGKPWTKAITQARDHMQSRVLTGVMMPVLVLLALVSSASFLVHGLNVQSATILGLLLGVSLTFAVLVWALRAATPLAAVAGGLINFVVLLSTASFSRPYDVEPYVRRILASGFTPVLLLFVLTFAATKAGKRRKQLAGLAESRKGRNAAQVIANLGAAALVGLPAALFNLASPRLYHAYPFGSLPGAVFLLAVLAEATADTVSSEIGQAFGGTPRMITTLRTVPPGTDGAVSSFGTFAGLAASALLAAVGGYAMRMPLDAALIAWLAAAAGLLFDSVLGATLERKGWLGNDLVNFSSTLFAGLLGLTVRIAELSLLR